MLKFGMPYDPAALRNLAEKAEGEAKWALPGGIVAGAMTGCLFGYAASLIFSTAMLWAWPGLVVGGVGGIFVGRRRAAALRLQSQMAWCQAQVEENTRAKPTLIP